VTRSHKWNEKHHGGDASAATIEREPYFDGDPKKVKKDGGGKANWYDCTFLLPWHSLSSIYSSSFLHIVQHHHIELG